MYPQNMALYGTVPPFQDPGVPIEFKIGRIGYIYIYHPCVLLTVTFFDCVMAIIFWLAYFGG